MDKLHKAFQNLINEYRHLRENPLWIHKEKPPKFPTSIHSQAGDILINRKIEREISDIAQLILPEYPTASVEYTSKEWRFSVRSACGFALCTVQFDDNMDDAIRSMKSIVKQEIQKLVDSKGILFQSMGCTLNLNPPEVPFVIGPVKFESTMIWLNHSQISEKIDKITRRRITKVFEGQKIGKRKPSIAASDEETIIEATSGYPMVCTVVTDRLAPELARKRSIIAARLAQTSFALLLNPLPSNLITQFSLSVDHGSYAMTTIQFSREARSIGYESKLIGMPTGVNLDWDEWLELAQIERNFFDVVGKTIEIWTSSSKYHCESSLVRCLSVSLYYFWDACQDTNDLMAIVKFVSSLETLTEGKKENGILRLAKARLSMNESDIYADDKTLRQIVRQLYRQARSRTLHGTNPEFAYDFTKTRTIAEHLARHCILSSIRLVENNPDADNPDIFLTEMPNAGKS